MSDNVNTFNAQNFRNNDFTSDDLLEKIHGIDVSFIARNVKLARDFVDQYLDYLDVDRSYLSDNFVIHRNANGYSRYYSEVSKLIGSCFYLHDIPDKNIEKGQIKSNAHFGASVRNQVGRFSKIIASFLVILDIAKSQISHNSLTNDEQRKYPTFNSQNIEKIKHKLQLSSIYAGYCARQRTNGGLYPFGDCIDENGILSHFISMNLLSTTGNALKEKFSSNEAILKKIEQDLGVPSYAPNTAFHNKTNFRSFLDKRKDKKYLRYFYSGVRLADQELLPKNNIHRENPSNDP